MGTNYLSQFRSADCALKSLMIYALALHGIKRSAFISANVRASLESRGFPEHSLHDLPSVLYTLSDAHPDIAVAVRTTVGMGLPEIGDRVITPLHEKNPALKFGISLLTRSAKVTYSNHVYDVKGELNGSPLLWEYLPGVPILQRNVEELSRRWFSTGMLANIVIINGLN